MITDKKIKKIKDEDIKIFWENRIQKRKDKIAYVNLFSKKHISIFKRIKWAYQRIKYGYCDIDWYDTDSWICTVLPLLLEDFSFNSVSHPYNISYEDWQKVLLQIADYLDDAGNSEKDNPYSEGHYISPLNKESFMKWEEERIEERRNSLKNAFDLISKWFFDLWD